MRTGVQRFCKIGVSLSFSRLVPLITDGINGCNYNLYIEGLKPISARGPKY